MQHMQRIGGILEQRFGGFPKSQSGDSACASASSPIMAFSGDFTPVLAKHTKSFNLIDTLSVGGGQDSAELRTVATPG
jgi:hypothetical protein